MNFCERSSVGRASRFQRGCRGFDSRRSLQNILSATVVWLSPIQHWTNPADNRPLNFAIVCVNAPTNYTLQVSTDLVTWDDRTAGFGSNCWHVRIEDGETNRFFVRAR